MGRRKIYKTEEEKSIAKKMQWMEYYQRNKEEINRKRMNKYYDKKNK